METLCKKISGSVRYGLVLTVEEARLVFRDTSLGERGWCAGDLGEIAV